MQRVDGDLLDRRIRNRDRALTDRVLAKQLFQQRCFAAAGSADDTQRLSAL
ncbi:hypothetical protein D3C85_1843210 [compost metagenome]